MDFALIHTETSSRARAGVLSTAHGTCSTPMFMPVGTCGSVKMISATELKQMGAQTVLANTYHLYLRPGCDILQHGGGIHSFSQYAGPMLTDSGGYQVFSLADRRRITEDGVIFSSHIDGSKHTFTPESVIDTQRKIGADILMAFDECIGHDADYSYTATSTARTHKWLTRCDTRIRNTAPLYGYEQVLFPIVQGGMYADLRIRSCQYCAQYAQVGVGIGGLSVGEPTEQMLDFCALCCEHLPPHHARYLMGVGKPEDLLNAIERGVDMFDCVMPTRNARNGMVFTTQGIVNIFNQKWANDHTPLDHLRTAPLSQLYTKAYLRHLFISKELLGARVASLQNVAFYLWLMEQSRSHILQNTFRSWKEHILPIITQRCQPMRWKDRWTHWVHVCRITRLDRYILRHYFMMIFFLCFVFVFISVPIDYSERVGDFAKNRNLTGKEIILEYFLPFIPSLMAVLANLIVLIGTIYFTSKLANRSEFIAIFASGVSLKRLLRPYLLGSIVVAAGLFWVLDKHIPKLNAMKDEFLQKKVNMMGESSIQRHYYAIIDSQTLLGIHEYNTDEKKGTGVVLKHFTDNQVTSITRAESIAWSEKDKAWILKNVTERRIHAYKETIEEYESEKLKIFIKPEDFQHNDQLKEQLSKAQLRDKIAFETLKGSEQVMFFLIELNQRNARPFSVIILTMIGAIVASRKTRGGSGLNIAIGIILGASYVITERFSSVFSTNAFMNPTVSSWLPNGLFALVAFLLYRRATR